MRKTRYLQLGDEGETHCYHVISRTTGRNVLFNYAEKEAFVAILQKRLRFCGLRALAWCFMGNHFHLLLEVLDHKTEVAKLSDRACFDRLKILDDEFATKQLLAQIAQFRAIGNLRGLHDIAEGIRKRLFSLSAFMKEFKMKMTEWYNRRHQRVGTLWEARFKSLIVEGSRALQIVAAYIDLNPLRAKLVTDPLHYRWCSYTAAVKHSDTDAQSAIATIIDQENAHWNTIIADYRLLLYGLGQAQAKAQNPDGIEKEKGGFTPEQIRTVWEKGGALDSIDCPQFT
jgi:putative transposase